MIKYTETLPDGSVKLWSSGDFPAALSGWYLTLLNFFKKNIVAFVTVLGTETRNAGDY